MPATRVEPLELAKIKLMLAKNAPDPFSRKGWVFEFKYDGFRIIANKRQLLTRNGMDVTRRFHPIAAALSHLPGEFVIDGELCCIDEHGVPDFEAMNSGGRGLQLTYFVFDLLYWDGRDYRSLPLLQRKQALRQLIPQNHPGIRYVDFIEETGTVMYEFAVSYGMEGLMAKRADSKYVAGRSDYWLKCKPKGTHDGFKRPLRAKTAEARKTVHSLLASTSPKKRGSKSKPTKSRTSAKVSRTLKKSKAASSPKTRSRRAKNAKTVRKIKRTRPKTTSRRR